MPKDLGRPIPPLYSSAGTVRKKLQRIYGVNSRSCSQSAALYPRQPGWMLSPGSYPLAGKQMPHHSDPCCNCRSRTRMSHLGGCDWCCRTSWMPLYWCPSCWIHGADLKVNGQRYGHRSFWIAPPDGWISCVHICRVLEAPLAAGGMC